MRLAAAKLQLIDQGELVTAGLTVGHIRRCRLFANLTLQQPVRLEGKQFSCR